MIRCKVISFRQRLAKEGATPTRQITNSNANSPTYMPRKFVIHYERASLASDKVIAIGKLVGAQALDLSTALRIRTRDSLNTQEAF